MRNRITATSSHAGSGDDDDHHGVDRNDDAVADGDEVHERKRPHSVTALYRNSNVTTTNCYRRPCGSPVPDAHNSLQLIILITHERYQCHKSGTRRNFYISQKPSQLRLWSYIRTVAHFAPSHSLSLSLCLSFSCSLSLYLSLLHCVSAFVSPFTPLPFLSLSLPLSLYLPPSRYIDITRGTA